MKNPKFNNENIYHAVTHEGNAVTESVLCGRAMGLMRNDIENLDVKMRTFATLCRDFDAKKAGAVYLRNHGATLHVQASMLRQLRDLTMQKGSPMWKAIDKCVRQLGEIATDIRNTADDGFTKKQMTAHGERVAKAREALHSCTVLPVEKEVVATDELL